MSIDLVKNSRLGDTVIDAPSLQIDFTGLCLFEEKGETCIVHLSQRRSCGSPGARSENRDRSEREFAAGLDSYCAVVLVWFGGFEQSRWPHSR